MNSREKTARELNCDLWDFLSDVECVCRVVMSLKLVIFKQAHVYKHPKNGAEIKT